MIILGISAFYHDAAAALLRDGVIVAAAQEERFSRKKHDADFPSQAIQYCLAEGNVSLDDLDAVVFYDKPFLTFERLLETYYAFAPRGFWSFLKAIPVWLKEKLFLKRLIRKRLQAIMPFDKKRLKLLFTEHHLAHAASAFLASPFESAAILTIDGVGEWATASIALGKGSTIKVFRELHFPHSLGLLYSAFTYFLGFKVNGGEYKLMGLAPYGHPKSDAVEKFGHIIREQLVDLKADGSLWLNPQYFTYAYRLRMVDDRQWEQLFGFPRRTPEAPLESHHCDLALAIQQFAEVVVLRLATEAQRLTGQNRLCLAGGVALNCVANGKLLRKNEFKDIFIQPAAGDAGGALGAALATHFIYFQQVRVPTAGDLMQGAALGPSFESATIEAWLKAKEIPYRRFDDSSALCDAVSDRIVEGEVVGWFEGRMEYGPRALGHRSILGDPRHPKMQQKLNLKIKKRESFRPFAPAVLAKEVHHYFEMDAPSPYMLLVAPIKPSLQHALPEDDYQLSVQNRLRLPHSDFPAITHVNYSARIQTVDDKTHPAFHKLLRAMKEKTGHGILINTSFNVKDEPIVCTPQDAYRCFRQTDMDCLVLEKFLLDKKEQPKWNS